MLAAGVISVAGDFERGDTVEILGPYGHTIGRGLIEYDSVDARAIIGLKTPQIIERLGPNIRSALIHRDNLVVDKSEIV